MPSYPDPAPRSPWKAHAAKRAESSGQHVLGKIFGKLIAVGFAPEEAREGGAWTQGLALPQRRQNPVLPCKTMYGGANAILERTRKPPIKN